MVKTRSIRRSGASAPVLWLFIDRRIADPVRSVRALAAVRAPGLFGVVLRARDRATRLALAAAIGPICRRARLALLVSGDVVLAHALRAGLHLPSVRRTARRRPRLLSASAHDAAELRRARAAGARLVFLAPVFPTATHPGESPLGAARAARIAGTAPPGMRLLALGGIDGRTARALSPRFTGAGAITALVT